jgi:hypothetical protein
MPSQYEHGPDFQTWNEAEIDRLRAALDRIAFCGAGEDYRILREIARKALETTTSTK